MAIRIEKAMTVHQPFAQLLILGEKKYEVRSWKYCPKFRGWVAIHAGKKWDEPQQATHTYLAQHGAGLPAISETIFSAIIGAVHICDARQMTNSAADARHAIASSVQHDDIPKKLLHSLFKHDPALSPSTLLKGYILEVDKTLIFPEPIMNVSGQLGFWGLYEYQQEAVAEQVRAAKALAA